jgi:hypothetical protein
MQEKIDAATQRQISDALSLAQQLGEVSIPFRGPSFEQAVATFVSEYRITHIVMGRTLRPTAAPLFVVVPCPFLWAVFWFYGRHSGCSFHALSSPHPRSAPIDHATSQAEQVAV